MADRDQVLDCDHRFELFVADDRIPYHFCRKCKLTMYNGAAYPLRDRAKAQEGG